VADVGERGRPWKRVRIDLNARTADGLVPAPLGDASAPLVPGDFVTVFEPEDRVAAVAEVVRIEHGHVLLGVDWSTLADDPVRVFAVWTMDDLELPMGYSRGTHKPIDATTSHVA
jgi:hypothetical protein